MTSHNRWRRALAIALIGLVATACVAVSTDASARDYRSPLGNFTVTVPSGLGMRTNQQHDREGGRVSFHDDFGSLSAISYWRPPADHAELISDPARRDLAYSNYLHAVVMPDMFRPASASARVLHEEFLGEPGVGREYFAVVDLPEGAALMDARTGRRLDSVRALLIFETGGFMYVLESEIGGGVFALGQARPNAVSSDAPLDDAALQNARDILHRFRETIAFRVAAPSASARSPSRESLAAALRQRESRDRLWGSGREVRFSPDQVARAFALTFDEFASEWPSRAQNSNGILENGRVRHVRLPVSFPLESGPCRLVHFAPLAQGEGGFALFLCRLTQPLTFVMVSYEATTNFDLESLARSLIAGDQDAWGVSAPACASVAPAPGFRTAGTLRKQIPARSLSRFRSSLYNRGQSGRLLFQGADAVRRRSMS